MREQEEGSRSSPTAKHPLGGKYPANSRISELRCALLLGLIEQAIEGVVILDRFGRQAR